MTTTSSLRALLSVGIAALLLGAVPASAATADTDPTSPFAGTSVSGVDVDDVRRARRWGGHGTSSTDRRRATPRR